jgi:hypothetical protein
VEKQFENITEKANPNIQNLTDVGTINHVESVSRNEKLISSHKIKSIMLKYEDEDANAIGHG